MSRYLDTLGTLVQLELRQRIRSVAWVVLVSVVFVLVGIVTALLWASITAFGGDVADSAGGLLSGGGFRPFVQVSVEVKM